MSRRASRAKRSGTLARRRAEQRSLFVISQVNQLARVRGRLVDFTGEVFESMARKDQRRWGEVYLRGLMLDGKRKSIEPMAARSAC